MQLVTNKQVDDALRRLGNYRVVRAQEEATKIEGIIGGWVVLALGLRETWGSNIEGGAMLDPVTKRWVPETNPLKMDVGWLQISRRYHYDALKNMLGVASRSWGPVVSGHTAMDAGYVPRFTDALRFTIKEMEEAVTYGAAHGVPYRHLRRFAVAAHNAGIGGALRGYNAGNIDMNTAGGDYSYWVMDARLKIRAWVSAHPNWMYTL